MPVTAAVSMNWKISMVEIVPAILAADAADYTAKLKRVGFADRVHIDITDGVFAPSQTINLAQVYKPAHAKTDLHLMMKRPQDQLETVISLEPDLVIIHAEADADLEPLIKELTDFGIKAGLAILPETSVESVKNLLPAIDHLLIFTGHLGFYGGEMQADCLGKIKEAKSIRPELEISVDGGVNQETAKLAIQAGADVLISGGFIVENADPKAAFQQLAGVSR